MRPAGPGLGAYTRYGGREHHDTIGILTGWKHVVAAIDRRECLEGSCVSHCGYGMYSPTMAGTTFRRGYLASG